MEGKRIWEAHPSPYGVPYYYNPQTKESRWSLPTGPLDLVVPVEAQAAPTKKNAKKKEPGKDAPAACKSGLGLGRIGWLFGKLSLEGTRFCPPALKPILIGKWRLAGHRTVRLALAKLGSEGIE